jgi:hypothetical protein
LRLVTPFCEAAFHSFSRGGRESESPSFRNTQSGAKTLHSIAVERKKPVQISGEATAIPRPNVFTEFSRFGKKCLTAHKYVGVLGACRKQLNLIITLPVDVRAPDDANQFKYWAFISYSHADARWGNWLHKKLETYRVPRSVVGKPSRDGNVPRRLFPIFRDREELTVSSDLGANLKNSLEQSRYLIVICSPNAARSRWVNEEARYFKSRRGEDRLLCFIVGGSPNADKPNSQQMNCFAPAVRYCLLPNGEVGQVRTSPIAADARTHADRAKRAKFKLLAGLLGISFDELWRRERRRRFNRAIQSTLAVSALALIGATWWDFESKQQAKRIAVAHYLNQGKQELAAGRRLQAAYCFAKARRVGGSISPLNESEREAAKALVEPVAVLRDGHQEWITSANFVDVDGVLTASWDKTVRLWDLKTGRSTLLVTEPAKVATARFSSDGQSFVTALWNGASEVWTRNKVLMTKLDHAGHRVNWAEFNPDGRQVVTACDDNLARIWTLGQDKALQPMLLLGHESYVKMAAFDREGERIVTASFDMTARIWDAKTGTHLLTLTPHPAPVNAAAFSPDGKHVATACLDGAVLLWDATKQSKPNTLMGHAGKRVNSVAYNRDGSRLLTTGDDRTAKVWDVSTGELLLSYEQHQDIVVNGAFSNDGRRIVTASKDKTAAVFDAAPKTRSLSQLIALAEKLGSTTPAPEAKPVSMANK